MNFVHCITFDLFANALLRAYRLTGNLADQPPL